MKKGWIFLLGVVVVLIWAGSLLAGTYNTLVRMDEAVKQSWAQVENVYQRRLDLIPNLVETVKRYAAHEKTTLTQVTEARAKAAGSISPEVLNDPAKFAGFEQTQGALSSALARLLVVVEQYPDLKANENFLSLQVQLEGTENRISVERGRFNEVAQAFNTRIRQFPTHWIGALFGFTAKEYFRSDPAAQKAPAVKF